MHAVLLRALQAVCLLLGCLVLRSVVFVARLYLARWSYSHSKAFKGIPGPPPAKLPIGGHAAACSGCVVIADVHVANARLVYLPLRLALPPNTFLL